jgi:PLP dependent protein
VTAAPSPVEPDPVLVEEIAARGAAVRARIAAHTDREVRIVCVTKAHPPVVAASAFAAGFGDLGENYAQELRDKAPAVGEGPRWHFIGQLQTNKVRLVSGTVDTWHTVDRRSVVVELARRVPGTRVFVQLDLAGLPGRGGCDPAAVPALVDEACAAGLDVVGLMGVAPPGPPEEARPGFRRLRELADDLGLPERSMGMSGDLEVAVEEGATVVRIGSDLVGPRATRHPV